MTALPGSLASPPPSAFSDPNPDMKYDPFKGFMIFVIVATVTINSFMMYMRQRKAEKILERMPGGGKDFTLIPAELRSRFGKIAGLTGWQLFITGAIGFGLAIAMSLL